MFRPPTGAKWLTGGREALVAMSMIAKLYRVQLTEQGAWCLGADLLHTHAWMLGSEQPDVFSSGSQDRHAAVSGLNGR